MSNSDYIVAISWILLALSCACVSTIIIGLIIDMFKNRKSKKNKNSKRRKGDN